ncbi:MAG: DNA repair protein RadA [Acidimicrobiales bacterium]
MAKVRTVFRCSGCGADAPKWIGRCATCGEWNTLVEEIETPEAIAITGPSALAVAVTEVDITNAAPQPTGIGELDRVLGGGLVAGSVTLIGGEPGIGKSTLLTELAALWAAAGERVLYVSAEESTQQVRARAERLGALSESLYLLAETMLPHIIAALDDVKPALLIVDSIQTVVDPDLGTAPGTVVQVRECAYRLVREAKERELPVVLVGHVTKDGTLAGPRVLEHVVDTVLAFEGERHHSLRLLRAVKHRYGPTNELGLFEMTEQGLVGVADPSGLFLADRRGGVAGSVVVSTVEGHRPLLVEVQALVSLSPLAVPRRSAQGIDHGRLSLLLAVLERRVGIHVNRDDVYASAVGGVRLVEPGADLGVALAIASASAGVALPEGVVVFGEVGLAGELRQVAQTPRRLSEAARHGFTHAIVPALAAAGPASITAVRVSTLAEAIDVLRLSPT